VLLAGPLLYLAIMLNNQLFFARFALPLVPFGCLFAAFGLQWVGVLARSLRLKSALLVSASLAVIAWPLLLSIRHNLLTEQTDTRVEAWRWVESNLPPGSRLAIQTYALPIARLGKPLTQGQVVASFGSLTNLERYERLTCDGVDYVLIASFQSDRQQTEGRGGQLTGYERLRNEGQRVVTFAPGHDDSSVPFHVDDTGLPFWRLEQYSQPGPTVTIYHLSPGLCQPPAKQGSSQSS
jgi:hypothetical protein